MLDEVILDKLRRVRLPVLFLGQGIKLFPFVDDPLAFLIAVFVVDEKFVGRQQFGEDVFVFL